MAPPEAAWPAAASWSLWACAASAACRAASAAARSFSIAASRLSIRFSGGQRDAQGLFGREVGMHNRAAAGEARRLHQLIVPIDGKRLGLFVDQRFDEGVEVTRIESGRGGRD